MIINAITELCIQYDKAADLLRVAWVDGRSMRHFQPAFTRLREVITQFNPCRIVLELNAMPDIPVYDQLWLSTNFMPALLRLPLQQVVIVQSAQRVYNQHVVEGLLAAVAHTIAFDVQLFGQAEAALAWLTDDSPRLPALLAEWAGSCAGAPSPGGEVAEPRARYQQQ